MRISVADLNFSPKLNHQVGMGGKMDEVVSVNTRGPFSEVAIHII